MTGGPRGLAFHARRLRPLIKAREVAENIGGVALRKPTATLLRTRSLP